MMKILVVGIVAVIVGLLALAMQADAHQAEPTAMQPLGWSYPVNCCSNQDCRKIPASWVREQPDGSYRLPTGEVVAHGDHRRKDSPDGQYHWCQIGGSPKGATICLFIPPPGS